MPPVPESVGPPSPDPAPPRFRETALASGLVSPERLDAAEIELQGVFEEAAAPVAIWDKRFAELLVRQGVLTKFQAREILAGRRRFRLGQYTVVDEIGRGGMGQVFLAEHSLMGRSVAIKVLPRSRATPEYEAAFRREIRLLASLDHENLVRALDAGYDAKVYYLVTEFVPGLDLRRQVRRHGPLDAPAAGAVITQAARGLAHAHEHGVIHRDVKPGNLIVSEDGRLKVLDLGLAGSDVDPETQQAGRVVGTMDYMAPEQIRAPESAGPAADVYALGCTLYFILSGQPPFPGGSRKEKAHRQLTEQPVPLQQLVDRIDPNLCRVVEAMMRKAVAERIGTAREVIERLRPWTPSVPVAMPRLPQAAAGHAFGDAAGAGADQGSSADHVPRSQDLLASRERSAARSRLEAKVSSTPSGAPPLPRPTTGFMPGALPGAPSGAASGPITGGPTAATVPPPVPEASLIVTSSPPPPPRRHVRKRGGGPHIAMPFVPALATVVGGGVFCLTLLLRAAARDSFERFFGPLASPLLLGVAAGLLAVAGSLVAERIAAKRR